MGVAKGKERWPEGGTEEAFWICIFRRHCTHLAMEGGTGLERPGGCFPSICLAFGILGLVTT